MGQIADKTYKAPDGSIYRVEADGSVTKIKGGRIQSNEPPSKYQITPEGKIYRVEEDGSITYLGNAEDRNTPPPSTDFTHNPKKNNHSWIWIIVVIIVIAIVAIALSTMDNYNYAPSQNKYENYPSENESNNIESENTDVTTVKSETPTDNRADDNEQYAFICDGNYYGTIGNADIHGNLTLATENPYGTLYYSNSGNGSGLQIYGSSDGHDWYEYYDGNLTGTIHFDYWDLAYHNFARGTYIRENDGKRFSISLYKSNF